MTAAAVLAFLSSVVDTAEHAPQLVTALEEFIGALKEKRDPTPAMKRAQAIAIAIELGLDPAKV